MLFSDIFHPWVISNLTSAFLLAGEDDRFFWSGRKHLQMGARLQRENLRYTG